MYRHIYSCRAGSSKPAFAPYGVPLPLYTENGFSPTKSPELPQKFKKAFSISEIHPTHKRFCAYVFLQYRITSQFALILAFECFNDDL